MPSPRTLPFRAGPYECYHYIGGNLAEVYIARDIRTGFNRALKVLGVGYEAGSELMQRFMAEGRAACLCSHPNIVTTYEAGSAGSLAYIAMEQLQGQTLKMMLERGLLRSMSERNRVARLGEWRVKQMEGDMYEIRVLLRDQSVTGQWFEREFIWHADLSLKKVNAASLPADGITPKEPDAAY